MGQKIVCFFLFLLLLVSCGSNRVYRIGIDPTFFPLDLHGSENNVLGLSIDLLQDLSHKKELSLATVTTNTNILLWGLNNDKYDAIISAMPPYNSLLKTYDFSDIFLEVGPVLVVRENSEIKTLDDLKGKGAGLQVGSPYQELIETAPGVLITNFDSIPQGLNDLVKENIDVMVIDQLSATIYIRDLYQNVLKIAGPPLRKEGLRLVTLKNHVPELLHKFNRGVETMQKDGELAKLTSKWSL